MLRLNTETANLINDELESVPEKYHKPFNSIHEALGIIREEYIELENEIFFGEKKAKKDLGFIAPLQMEAKLEVKNLHSQRIKAEAIQVAAMCARLIQEL